MGAGVGVNVDGGVRVSMGVLVILLSYYTHTHTPGIKTMFASSIEAALRTSLIIFNLCYESRI